jgi:hypothetical protein
MLNLSLGPSLGEMVDAAKKMSPTDRNILRATLEAMDCRPVAAGLSHGSMAGRSSAANVPSQCVGTGQLLYHSSGPYKGLPLSVTNRQQMQQFLKKPHPGISRSELNREFWSLDPTGHVRMKTPALNTIPAVRAAEDAYRTSKQALWKFGQDHPQLRMNPDVAPCELLSSCEFDEYKALKESVGELKLAYDAVKAKFNPAIKRTGGGSDSSTNVPVLNPEGGSDSSNSALALQPGKNQ